MKLLRFSGFHFLGYISGTTRPISLKFIGRRSRPHTIQEKQIIKSVTIYVSYSVYGQTDGQTDFFLLIWHL